MSTGLWKRLKVAAVLTAMACTLPTTDSDPPRLPSLDEQPIEPDPGDDTYFNADVTWEFIGGYEGFDVPDADRATAFSIESWVQGGEAFANMTRTSPITLFGATVPIDVAAASFDLGSGFRARGRTGAVLAIPDSASLVNSIRTSPPVPPEAGGLRAAPAAGVGQGSTAGLPRRSGTGAFIGPVQAAERLARLRTLGATETRVAVGRLQFRATRGNEEYVFDFDERVGTVTRTEIRRGGRPITRTIDHYVPVTGGHVLRSSIIETVNADGTVGHRMIQTHQYRSAGRRGP